MIFLNRMRVINWYLYRDVTVQFDRQMTMVTAENGTGKTALVDALRFAMLGDTSFNAAADSKGHGRRTLKSYVRGLISPDGEEYYRPESKVNTVTSHIVLECYDEVNDQYFILGTILECRGTTDPTVSRYTMNHTRLEEVPCTQVTDGKRYIQTIRGFQDTAKVELMNKGDAMYAFTQMLGIPMRESGGKLSEYRRKQTAILSYNPRADIHAFIHDYVLPEKKIDALDDLKEKKEAIDTIKKQMDLAEKELALVSEILDQYEEAEKHADALLRNEILVKYHAVNETGRILKVSREKEQQEREEQEILTSQLENLRQQSADLEGRRQELRDSLESSDIYRQIENEEANQHRLQIEEGAKEKEQQRVLDFQEQILAVPDQFPEMAWIRDEDALRDLNSQQLGAAEKQQAVTKAKGAVKECQKTYQEKFYSQSSQLTQIEQDMTEQARLLEDYQNYRPDKEKLSDYIGLRDEINREFEKRGIHSQARMAYEDVSGLTDETWRDALESLLGRARYTVLVEPAYYEIADQVFIRSGYKGAHLFNTKKLMQKKILREADSVVRFLDIQNPTTRRYFEYQLGKFHTAEEEQVRNYDYAIAKTGKTSRNLDNFYTNAHGHMIYYLGTEAFKKNAETARQTLQQLQAQKEQAQATLEEYRDKIGVLDGYMSLFQDYDLDVSKELAQIRTEIMASKRRISELRRSLKSDPDRAVLQQQLDQTEARLKTIDTDINEKQQNISELSADIRSVGKDIRQTESELGRAKAEMDAEEAAYPTQTVEAEQEYNDPKKQARPWTNPRTEADHQNAQKGAEAETVSLQNQYRMQFDQTAPAALGNRPWYAEKKQRIEVHDIQQIRAKLEAETATQEQIFKNEFVHKILDHYNTAIDMFLDINRELSRHPFSGTTYKFTYQRRGEDGSMYKKILEYAEATASEADRFEPQGELFEYGLEANLSDKDEKLVREMDRIIQQITTSDDMEDYADYRNYMDYDVLITNDKLKGKRLSQQNRYNSGAEVQIPYLLMLLSSLLMIYNEHPNSMRLVIMDEPFTKMDPGKTRQMLEFMQAQNFQSIFCVPEPKEAIIERCGQIVGLAKINGQVRVVNKTTDEEQVKVVQGELKEKANGL